MCAFQCTTSDQHPGHLDLYPHTAKGSGTSFVLPQRAGVQCGILSYTIQNVYNSYIKHKKYLLVYFYKLTLFS